MADTKAKKAKHLVVVESPAKAKTINRYLGNDYTVKASMGHVRDLPPKDIGVDIEHGFNPTYETLATRKKVLSELKQLAKSADLVYLATDLDREGEAIAWHLAEALKLKPQQIRRVIFNEITANAIRNAFSHPLELDMNKVNAQQARRILDRIVGYQVSPLLWKKVARGLSAGRVQSVAVRLIVEREREREAFTPEEYWRINALFTDKLQKAIEMSDRWKQFIAQRDSKDKPPTLEQQQQFLTDIGALRAELTRLGGKKFMPENSQQALEAVKALKLDIKDIITTEDPQGKGPAANRVEIISELSPETPGFKIAQINLKQRKSSPSAPFTTSSLQQAASVQLHFSASRTMRVAQQLYEGIDIPVEGHVGLITYMRTDSTQLSREAVSHAREFIEKSFGKQYLPDSPKVYSSAKRAQEAHEAVRPTVAGRTPQQLRGHMSDDQFKLYELIWKRFICCQMESAVWNTTEVIITTESDLGTVEFKALGRQLAFDGYLKVAGIPKGGDQILPQFQQDQPVAPVEIKSDQKFTQPPPRFTEASLVKALEAEGIGRPSTYAAIINTIKERNYVEIQDRTFVPTDLGLVVTDKLVRHLPRVFDLHFTAYMEDQLDQVEESKVDWVKVLEDFYGPFRSNLDKAADEMVHAKAETQPSEYTCPQCQKEMLYRFNKNGRYLACSGYPECKETSPVDSDGKIARPELMDIACPKCNSPMLLRKGRFGPFLSCSAYPNCDGIVNLDKKGFVKQPTVPPLLTDQKCTKCEAPINLRRGKRGPWMSCSKFPKCRGRLAWSSLDEETQKRLETELMNHEKQNPQVTICDTKGNPLGDTHVPKPLEDKG